MGMQRSQRTPSTPGARPAAVEMHGESGWRRGCRCDLCRTAHAAACREWRRSTTLRSWSPALRSRLLTHLAEGVELTTAASAVAATVQSVHALAGIDPQFARDLDAALMAGRKPDLAHGTESAYRHGRCRCPECRTAHQHSPKPRSVDPIVQRYRNGVKTAVLAAELGVSAVTVRSYLRSAGVTQPRGTPMGDHVQCLECGLWYEVLARHLRYVHAMTTRQYQARHDAAILRPT